MSFDEERIDLRKEKEEEEAEFQINNIDDDVNQEELVGKVQPVVEADDAAFKPYDKVKVKFDKFVNLVSTHAYEEIFDKYVDEDVVISTDLLTDLANAHEEKQDRKMPLIFLVGIFLGVVLTWILLKT